MSLKKSRLRKKQKSAAATLLGLALIAVALLAIGGLIYMRVALGARPAIDSATYCPVAGPTERVAIVVDMTDPIGPVVRSRVSDALDAVIEELPAGAKISLGLVQQQGAGFEETIPSLCHPGAPSEANPIYENPRLVADRFEQDFLAPLKAHLARLLSQPTADTSPILESVQAVATVAFGADRETPRRLILVSDLIQHSDVVSLYRGQTWESFAASSASRRMGRALEDVEVHLLQLPRESAKEAVHEQALIFWREYLQAQGVRRVTRRVVGDL